LAEAPKFPNAITLTCQTTPCFGVRVHILSIHRKIDFGLNRLLKPKNNPIQP
jgi:hypothetical protein